MKIKALLDQDENPINIAEVGDAVTNDEIKKLVKLDREIVHIIDVKPRKDIKNFFEDEEVNKSKAMPLFAIMSAAGIFKADSVIKQISIISHLPDEIRTKFADFFFRTKNMETIIKFGIDEIPSNKHIVMNITIMMCLGMDMSLVRWLCNEFGTSIHEIIEDASK